MKPPHWRYWKCQKASHNSKLERPSNVVAPDDNHHARMVRYLSSASASVVEFLYSLHNNLCCRCKSALMSAFVCFSSDCVRWKRQVLSRLPVDALAAVRGLHSTGSRERTASLHSTVDANVVHRNTKASTGSCEAAVTGLHSNPLTAASGCFGC